MSSVYWPLPVMKRKSSLRRTAAPMPVAFPGTSLPIPSASACAAAACGASTRHGLGTGRDRLDDVVVAGAAAEIALEFLADGLLVEVVALAVDDVDRGHDHARRAEAALQAVVLAERLLHRVQLLAVGEALDGAHVGAVRRQHQERA